MRRAGDRHGFPKQLKIPKTCAPFRMFEFQLQSFGTTRGGWFINYPTRSYYFFSRPSAFFSREASMKSKKREKPPPFSFFGVSFSTGQSRSFRSASSTACARKKKKRRKNDETFLKYWGLSGAKACKSCRSRQELSNSNEYLVFTCKIWRRYSRERTLPPKIKIIIS